MGAAPLQSRERFVPPHLTKDQTRPVASYLSEHGIPRGSQEDLQQFSWAEGKWAHETAGSMTKTHQTYVKELTKLLVDRFPTLESAEAFAKDMGFEAHGAQTHAKFASAFEMELLKVLDSRPADASKSDVMLQVPYLAPPFERQASSLQSFLQTLQPLFSHNSVESALISFSEKDTKVRRLIVANSLTKLPFVINGCEFHCTVISSDQSVIELSAPSEPTCELLQVWHDICNTKTIMAKQTHWVTNPENIRSKVEGYWDQFRNRDCPDSDSDFPPIHEAIHILNESLPVWDEITEKPTPSMWKRAVMSFKANAARGSDGFSSGDLKLLPLKAWSDIQELFDTFTDWPKVLGFCKGWKVDQPLDQNPSLKKWPVWKFAGSQLVSSE